MKIQMLILALLVAPFIYGQDSTMNRSSKASIDVSFGYGFPIIPQYVIYEDYYDANNQFTRTMKKNSLGQGITSTISISYNVKSFFQVTLGGYSNQGRELNTYHYKSDANPQIYDDTYSRVNTVGATIGIGLINQGDKWDLAARSSFILGFYNRGYYEDIWGDQQFHRERIVTNSGNLSYGYMGTVSVLRKLGTRFGIGLEAFFVNLIWSPKQGRFTKWTVNGTDSLSSMNQDYLTFEYSNSFGPTSPNPNVFATAFDYVLSSGGLRMKISYNL